MPLYKLKHTEKFACAALYACVPFNYMPTSLQLPLHHEEKGKYSRGGSGYYDPCLAL